jgi:hypothetical protein
MLIFCCFCGYSGPDRTYRNVGVKDYPDDHLCHLCDTKEEEET